MRLWKLLIETMQSISMSYPGHVQGVKNNTISIRLLEIANEKLFFEIFEIAYTHTAGGEKSL